MHSFTIQATTKLVPVNPGMRRSESTPLGLDEDYSGAVGWNEDSSGPNAWDQYSSWIVGWDEGFSGAVGWDGKDDSYKTLKPPGRQAEVDVTAQCDITTASGGNNDEDETTSPEADRPVVAAGCE